MKNRKNPLTHMVVAVMCFATFTVAGQITNPILPERIAVTARPSIDSIVLRWAPMNFNVWRYGNENGYRIERYVIARNGRLLSPPEMVILHPSMKPVPEEQWEPLLATDRYAAIAAQALFGDRFELDLTQNDITTVVDKVKENDQRFAFALFGADISPAVAKASGLSFTDRKVNKGEKYLYRVVINSMDSLRGNVFLSASDPYVLPTPQDLRATFSEKIVSLRWTKDENGYYTAFRLERSTDGQHFSPASTAPLVTVSPVESKGTRYEYAVDSLRDLSHTVYYRVRGITPFGEDSPPSNVVSGRPTPTVGQVPYILSVDNVQNTSLHVHWNFPMENNNAIRGFEVERSSKPGVGFLPLTPALIAPDIRDYMDAVPDQVNYYRVSAVGLDNQAYPSHVYFAQLIDSIPPVSPVDVQGKIDNDGNVTLKWNPNAEADISGYRVYKAFRRSQEFAQVTDGPVEKNVFNDHVDLNTLNDAVYYRVMAIDRNQNHSSLSQVAMLPLPDHVRPQPPVLLPPLGDSTGIIIQWMPGGSEDIVRYAVYRKDVSKLQWQLLGVVQAGTDTVFTFYDNSAAPRLLNTYTVVSIDDAGLESSPANPMSGMRTVNMLSEPVLWRKSIANTEGNKITLKWIYDLSAISRFCLFRAVDDRPPVLIKTLGPNEREFTDIMKPGRHYAYRIMAEFEDGHKSHLSKEYAYQY
jgi:fibronectin type 3 domain-containing protein